MSSRQRRSKAARRRMPSAARVLTGGSGLAVVGTLLSGSVAHAAGVSVQVTTLADNSSPSSTLQTPETLPDAIAYANAHGGGEIGFASNLSGTIQLQHALTITQPTQIYEAHPLDQITIDGSGLSAPIFTLTGSAGTSLGTQLDNLTLTGGGGSGVAFGGAVDAGTGYTILDHVVIEHSTAEQGGAVADRYGTLRVRYSTLADDSSTVGAGGAIFMQGGGQLTVEDSTLSGNTASGTGGGFAVYQGSGATPPTVQLANSTIYQNEAKYGGALFFGPNYGTGGSPYLKAVADTIVDNSAKQIGGAAVYDAPATFNSTILADNHSTDPTSPLGTDLCARRGATAYLLGSLLQDATAQACDNATLVHSITGVSPELEPLANNGGPTATLLPQPGSPVIDQGDASGGPFRLGSDQRGGSYKRIVSLAGYPVPSWGDGSDIGAVEVQSSSVLAATITGMFPSFGNAGQVVTIHGTNLLNTRSVTFNGRAAKILSDTQTQLRVQAPAGVHGVAEVKLTSPDGSAHIVPGGFGYLQSSGRRLDDQQITITTPPSNLALPVDGTAPLQFSSTEIRDSHAPRLQFKQAQLYYNGGIRRVIHRIKRSHGHRHRVRVVIHEPDLTLHRTHDTISLPLSRLHAGTNTITIRVDYSERLSHPHGHHRTRQVETTLTVSIRLA